MHDRERLTRKQTTQGKGQVGRKSTAQAEKRHSDLLSPGSVLTPDDILRLQRTIGNQAVMRLLAQRQAASSAPHSAPNIQRWDIQNNEAIPWGNARRIRAVESGQAVFFYEDAQGDEIVVKAEDAPVGLTQLMSEIHSQISNTPSVYTRDATPYKEVIRDQIGTPNLTSDQSWTTVGQMDRIANNVEGDTPAEKARTFHQGAVEQTPKVHVMTLAPGKSMSKLATPGQTEGNEKGARALFEDSGYLYTLGMVTATDLFLGNQDRLYAGNFGNWFTDVQGNQTKVTLIDHMDYGARVLWQSQGKDFRLELLDHLATGALPATANYLVDMMGQEMTVSGDETAPEWLEEGERGDMIRRWLIMGMKEGRNRIIKTFATKKTSDIGRQMKTTAQNLEQQDTEQGDGPEQSSYWDKLKTRARYLKRLG